MKFDYQSSSNYSNLLTKLKAIDSDFGNNAEVRYILAEDKSQMLDLDPKTGELYIARLFNNFKINIYAPS